MTIVIEIFLDGTKLNLASEHQILVQCISRYRCNFITVYSLILIFCYAKSVASKLSID